MLFLLKSNQPTYVNGHNVGLYQLYNGDTDCSILPSSRLANRWWQPPPLEAGNGATPAATTGGRQWSDPPRQTVQDAVHQLQPIPLW